MKSISSVRIVRTNRVYCKPDWSYETSGTTRWIPGQKVPFQFNYNLWIILQGAGDVKTDGRCYQISTGNCLILQRGNHYQFSHDPENPLAVFVVHFDILNKKEELIFPELAFTHQVDHLDFLVQMIDRLEQSWMQSDTSANIWLRACLFEILQGDSPVNPNRCRPEQLAEIKKICSEIREEPGNQYDINTLGKRLNCSSYHFARLFKEVNGIPPNEYILRARIHLAKGLLHASNYSISRIAQILGYSDIYFFSRQFKHKTGSTPSEYRRGG